MKKFDDALRRVLRVSKDDMKKLLASDEARAAVKQKRGRKPKGRGTMVTGSASL